MQSVPVAYQQSYMPKKTNHVLHLLLTLVTCGFWAPVWLILAIVNANSKDVVTTYTTGQPPFAAPYPPQQYAPQPYPSPQYQSQPYQSQPYQSQPYQSQPYPPQPYPPQPYPPQPMQALPPAPPAPPQYPHQ
ncbi:hypothetical protein Ahu01nite_003250 [Winogradskya humida]|uniref:Uncharacterized protein n=1 Tax=Winogradskya humida TaxID=113566 RepID=A0ABQ3ZF65_9ACTN|nr:hypothetical protein Ahu01nite_003250 [Actinoplanes humidus]